jgi:hypothetical protein
MRGLQNTQPSQRPEVVDFFDQFIDDRFVIAHELEPIGTQIVEGRGYQGIIYDAPAELMPYGIENGEVEVDMSSARTGTAWTPGWLRMTMNSGPSVMLLDTDFLDSSLIVDDLAHPIAANFRLFSSALRSLVPSKTTGVPLEQVAESIHLFSPNSSNHLRVSNGQDFFNHSETESVDDTMHAIALATRKKHRSGKIVEIRADISETLYDRTKGINSSYDVELNAGQPHVSFREVIDGISVRIDQPTRQHTQALQEAVERLLDASLMTPRPSQS